MLRRIFSYEIYKATRDYFPLAVMILLLLVGLIYSIHTHNNQDAKRIPDFDKAQILQQYEGHLDQIKEWIQHGSLTDDELEQAKDTVNKYEFFLKNDKTEYEYLSILELGSRITDYDSALLMIQIAKTLLLILLAYSIYRSAVIFASDYNGAYKHILMSPFTKEHLFTGKLLYWFIEITIYLLLIISVCTLVYVLYGAQPTEFLIHDHSDYYSINLWELFTSIITAYSILILILGAMAMFLGIISHSQTLGIALPIIAFLVNIALFCILTNSLYHDNELIKSWTDVNYLPFISIQQGSFLGFNVKFQVLSLIHILVAIILIIAARVIRMKEDI